MDVGTLKSVLKFVPVDVIISAFTEFVVNTIKNPASVKKYGKVLIPLRDALIAKYPLDNG